MPENEEENTGTTSITTATVESMEDILGIPGASVAMLPEEDKKPSMFSRENTDVSFLDKDEEEEEGAEIKMNTNKASALLDSLVQQNGSDEEQEEAKATSAGRPKTDKSALLDFTKKWIEEGKLKPFEDNEGIAEDITKYSVKDFEELFEANLQAKEVKGKKEGWGEFFEDLPEELQYLHQHHAKGGDIRAALQGLARAEERRNLSVDDEQDQEQIARVYLRHTTSHDEEEINDTIDEMKDRGELAAKAAKFKPKLDQIEQQILAEDLKKHEQRAQQQQAMALKYRDSVYDAIQPGDLNGIKLDKKTQGTLYAGLVQPNYPSLSGKPTNLLGHLLEKYQFVEPNHGLIAEALWLLSDPEAYRSKVKEGAKKEVTEKTVRMLKDAEKDKNGSSSNDEDAEIKRTGVKSDGLKRNNTNFFRRG